MDDEKDYERIGRFIYGMQRAGLDDARLREMAADRAHPERAAQAARLAQLFDMIVPRQGQVLSGEELTHTLDEAWHLFQACSRAG